jgi:hypothetical protein
MTEQKKVLWPFPPSRGRRKKMDTFYLLLVQQRNEGRHVKMDDALKKMFSVFWVQTMLMMLRESFLAFATFRIKTGPPLNKRSTRLFFF